jgi:hypothetical protein
MLVRWTLTVVEGSAAFRDVLMCVQGDRKYSKKKKESLVKNPPRKLNNHQKATKRSKIPKQQATK